MQPTLNSSIYHRSNGVREPVPVALVSDDTTKDAFGRLRTATPFSIHDSTNIHDLQPALWQSETSGAGSAITHLGAETAVELKAGTGATDYALRQTWRYYNYIPGNSQLVTITGVLGDQVANTDKRLGIFDDNNGLFFEMNGTLGPLVVRRTSTSGTPVNVFVPQLETSVGAGDGWNLDDLSGTGGAKNPSGIAIDFTKAQIFLIDFQWLGVGRVRFAVNIDGVTIPVHEMLHANILTEVYMATASLPLRYEVRNTAATAAATTLKEICSSIISEGALTPAGVEFHVSHGITLRSVGTPLTPILAIRLKNAFGVKSDNRRTGRIIHYSMYNDGNQAVHYELAHLSGVTAGAETWVSVDASSAMEFSTDIAAIVAAHQHSVDKDYISSKGASSGSEDVATRNRHAFLSQNIASTQSQVMVLLAQSLSGTSDVGGSVGWLEFE